jgi:uncharacterized protein involved in exopolysaccharide biosynthesis
MGTSGLMSQFSGLASLAGIQTADDSRKSEALAVLQSEALTEKYISDNHLLPVLFSKKWDEKLGKWRTSDPSKVPTLWKANELFRDEIRVVTSNPKTGIVTVKITWRDPAIAANWANGIVKLTNDYLRNRAIDESERNIAYLTTEAGKTDQVGVKEAIYAILQTQIGKVMLARGSEEYAFRILDKAVPPERASSPRKLLWLIGGFTAGFALGMLTIFVRASGIR